MSHYCIQKLSDLDFILNDEIMLFGNINSIDEEIYHNMWIIDIEREFCKKIALQDLTMFIKNLLQNRSLQVESKYPGAKATFYLWYDPQSIQFRFNILSGENITLPFGCKLNILNSYETILQKFLTEAQSEINALSWGNMKILNPGDPAWDDDEDDRIDWVQDVYVTTLP